MSDVSDAPTPRVGHSRLPPEVVAAAIRTAAGNLAVAAQALGLSRRRVKQYVDQHALCRRAVKQGHDQLVDEAEHALRRAIRVGESWAVTLALRGPGRRRGWGERDDRGMIPIEAAQAFFGAVMTLIREHVRDQEALAGLNAGLNRYLAAPLGPLGEEVEVEATPEGSDADSGD